MLRGAFAFMAEPERDEVRRAFQMASVEWSFRNLRTLGFSPRRIVDVGAYVGGWTRMAKAIFPEAAVMMVEAQPSKEPELKRACAEYTGEVNYRLALLGPEEREGVRFYELETGSSVLAEQSSIARKEATHRMLTLDGVLAESGFGGADLLKLDVQGYELEVLKGAGGALSGAEVVLLEVSLLRINEGAPLLRDVLNFMGERGFRAYDICSFIRRPLDNALWQTDIIFVSETSRLLASRSFN
jgi:FkbM family methyltransferase